MTSVDDRYWPDPLYGDDCCGEFQRLLRQIIDTDLTTGKITSVNLRAGQSSGLCETVTLRVPRDWALGEDLDNDTDRIRG